MSRIRIEENLNIYNPDDNGCGIYMIKSYVHPDRFYIGSATNLYDRLRRHLMELRLNYHHSHKLQAHYNKYGKEDLYSVVLERFILPDRKLMIDTEQHYIDTLNPFFNECKIAGSSLGRKHSPETIEKCRQSKLGDKNPMFGKHPSPESIELRASKRRGIPPSEANINATIKRLTGHPKSDEVKNKIRETLKNKYKNGYISHNKGRKNGPMAEEIKRKMSESQKKRWAIKKLNTKR
jgi:group I intron endonuclease